MTNIWEIIFTVATIGLSAFGGLLKYSFNELKDGWKKLRQEHDDLETKYHETREKLIALESKAVSKDQMDSVMKEFESKVNDNLNRLFEQQNKLFNEKMDSLKELLTSKIQRP